MLLVPAYAVVVAAPSGPDQGCPTPRQITDALTARIPAVVVTGGEASTPGVLKLSVAGGTGTTPLRIELTDQGGEARLFRNLTVAERGRGDCPALAETVALIVDRFLHDLGYEAPPTAIPVPAREAPADNLARGPPPAPAGASRFDLFAGGSWRGASAEESDFEVGIGLGFERGVGRRRLAATISGGVSSARTAMFPAADGSLATLRRMPFRIGLFLPLPAGPGQLEPGVRLGFDRVVASLPAAGLLPAKNDPHTRPRAELALGYRVAMLSRLFARLGASIGVGVADTWKKLNGDIEFTEPGFYFKSGLELGFSFQ